MQTRHLVETMETSTNTIGSSSHSYNRMPDILSKNRPPALYPIPRICEIPRLPLIPSQDLARHFACLAWETVRDAAAREDARMPPGTPPTMDSHYDVAGGVPEMPESSSDWTTPPFRDAASTFRETAVMESDGLIAMDTGALVDVNSGVHFAVDRAALDSIVSSGSLHAIVSL